MDLTIVKEEFDRVHDRWGNLSLGETAPPPPLPNHSMEHLISEYSLPLGVLCFFSLLLGLPLEINRTWDLQGGRHLLTTFEVKLLSSEKLPQ